jgi:uncharacterized BrkB/YihY/UPF0761 family membrane protein
VTTVGARAESTLTDWRARSAVVDTLAAIIERDRASFGTVVGAAIALRLFVFLLPTTLFLVGLLVLLQGGLDPEDINEAAGLTASVADQIALAMTQETAAGWIALATGIVGMATGGRALARVMMAGSALAWNTPIRRGGMLRVMRVVVLVVLAVVVAATVVNRVRLAAGIAVGGVTMIAAAAMYIVLFTVLLAVLPSATRDPGSALPGAVLAGSSVAGLQALTQLYVVQRLGGASELYGAMGSAVVLVGWLFVFGRVVMFSVVLNAVMHERYGSVSQLVFALPVLRVLPRRIPAVGRFFDLGAGRSPGSTDEPTR